MATVRNSIPDFSVANPFYAGATVTIYTVDENLAATATKATLYDAPTGSGTLTNAQTLDSEGKWEQPVYVDRPVVMSVQTGSGTHSTGVVGLGPRWRGIYTIGQTYYPGEFLLHPTEPVMYAVNEGFTASSFNSDVSNGYIDAVLDASDLTDSFTGSGNITTLGTISSGTWQGTIIGVAYGGTGLGTYATGDVIYAVDPGTLGRLAATATGNALLSGGAATAPAWGKIGLTTHVSGVLPIANGGTGAASQGAAQTALGVYSTAVIDAALALLAPLAAPTFTNRLRLAGSTSGYAGLKSPAIGPSVDFILPATDAYGPLWSDGAGNLSFKGGAWERINETTLTVSGGVVLTLASTYRAFRLTVIDVATGTGGAGVALFSRVDLGSGTLSGGSDYVQEGGYWEGSTGGAANAAASVMSLTTGVASNERVCGEAFLTPGSASSAAHVNGHFRYVNSGATLSTALLGGRVASNGRATTITIGFVGQNFLASGYIILEGLRP